ncbi:MAG: hypothetical protein HQK51_21140, partial [Oligoflexia bacterium]|nr:hypothetical protein [Oligoflexia bacterium]
LNENSIVNISDEQTSASSKREIVDQQSPILLDSSSHKNELDEEIIISISK